MVDLPWHVQIIPAIGTIAIAGSLSLVTNQAIVTGSAIYNSSSTQNDEYGWDLILAKGTWLLEFLAQKNVNNAIAQLRLDGANLTTHDLYAASLSYSNYFQSVGISVAASGKHRVSFKAATRNASNTTGWFMPIQFVSLRRTA
jgi:hypothetical protein